MNPVSTRIAGSRLIAGAAILFGIVAAAPAQTSLTWTGGGADTNWTTVANWGGTAYPNNDQPNLGDTYNATVTSGSPTLNVDITINNLTLSASGLSGAGNLTVNGLFTWSGEMEGTGTVSLKGGANLSSGVLGQSIINGNAGTVTFGGTGQNISSNSASAVWTNQAGATFVLAGDNSLLTGSSSGTFNNAGTFQKTAGVANSQIQWTFNNAGLVSVTGGTLVFEGNGTDTGSYFVGSGANLTFGGATRFLNGPVTGSGTVSFSGSNVPYVTIGGAANAYAVTGDTTINGSGSAPVLFDSPASTGTLHMAGRGILDGTASFTVNGLFTWAGGTMQGSGTTILNGGATGGGLLNRTVVNAAGSTASTSGMMSVSSNAVWTNQAGATFILPNSVSLSTSSGGTGTFTNDGVFQRTGGTGTSAIAWTFNNAGTVNVTTGTLAISGSGTDTGGYSVASGATLSFTAPRTLDGPVTGSGSVTFASNNITVGGLANSYAMTGDTTVSVGTVSYNAASSTGTLHITDSSGAGSTVSGTAGLTVNGVLTWSGGTMQGSGTTTLLGGATLSGYLSLDRTVVNSGNGIVTFTSGPYLYSNSTNANWINQPGTTFTIAADVTLNTIGNGLGTFTNNGTFLKTGGTGTSTIAWNFTNTGTLTSTSGTLDFDGAFVAKVTNTGSIIVGGTESGIVTFGGAANVTNYVASTQTLTGGTWRVLAGGTLDFNTFRPIATVAAGTTIELNGSSSVFGALENHLTTNAGTLNIFGGRSFMPGGPLTDSGTLAVGQSSGDGSVFTGGVTVVSGGILRGTGAVTPPAGQAVTVNNGGTIMGGQSGSAGVLTIALPAGQDFALSGNLAVNVSGTTPPDVNGLSSSVSRIALAGGGLALTGADLTLDFSGIGMTGSGSNDPNGNGSGFWTNAANYNDAAHDGYVWRVLDPGTDISGTAPTVFNPDYTFGSFSDFIGTGGVLTLTGGGTPDAVYLAFTPIPEPSSLMLIAGFGLPAANLIRRRSGQP